jgi:hypothetical protein
MWITNVATIRNDLENVFLHSGASNPTEAVTSILAQVTNLRYRVGPRYLPSTRHQRAATRSAKRIGAMAAK